MQAQGARDVPGCRSARIPAWVAWCRAATVGECCLSIDSVQPALFPRGSGRMPPDSVLTAAGSPVRLEPLAPRHRLLYHALYGCPDVMSAIADPLDPVRIDAQFARVLRHNAASNPGHRAWAIEPVQGRSQAFGIAALLRDGERVELGIMLHPGAWRRGIGTGAIKAMLPYAFEAMKVEFVDATCRAERLPVIQRLLAPFDFQSRVGRRAGEVDWRLDGRRWRAKHATAHAAPRK